MAWTAVCITIVFLAIKGNIWTSSYKKEEEIIGLDATEHGLASAYAGFEISTSELSYDAYEYEEIGSEKMDSAVPAIVKQADIPDDKKITKVEILMKQERFERLKKAMNEIGVTGMTVTQVSGCMVHKKERQNIVVYLLKCSFFLRFQ